MLVKINPSKAKYAVLQSKKEGFGYCDVILYHGALSCLGTAL